jgi:hypothetical protein
LVRLGEFAQAKPPGVSRLRVVFGFDRRCLVG